MYLSNFAPKNVRYIEVSAITKHRSAVVAVLSAKSRFSAKTVSVKPSFWCTGFLKKIRVYQYPILKNIRVGLRVSSTGFH